MKIVGFKKPILPDSKQRSSAWAALLLRNHCQSSLSVLLSPHLDVLDSPSSGVSIPLLFSLSAIWMLVIFQGGEQRDQAVDSPRERFQLELRLAVEKLPSRAETGAEKQQQQQQQQQQTTEPTKTNQTK